MSRIINTNTIGPITLRVSDNPLTITATGKVTATGAGNAGIYGGSGTAWRITNAGTVTSSGGLGITLRRGGTVQNGLASGSTALISGSTAGIGIYGAAGNVTNYGSISGSYGVLLNAGGTVTNTAAAAITGSN